LVKVASVHAGHELNLALEVILNVLHLCSIVHIILVIGWLAQELIEVVGPHDLVEPLRLKGFWLELHVQNILPNQSILKEEKGVQGYFPSGSRILALSDVEIL